MPFFKPNVEKLKAKGDVNGLIEALHYPDQEIIKAASAALGQLGAPAVDRLIPALHAENPTVTYFAAWILGEIRDARAVEPLIYALQNKNKELRKQAAQALGKIGDAQAVEPLILALKDRDGDVLGQVTAALDRLGWKPNNDRNGAYYWSVKREWKKCVEIGALAVEPLIDALKRDESDVRLEAADELVKIGVPVVKPLIDAMKGDDRNVRLEVANVLVKIGAPVVKPLIDALEGDERNVRLEAANVLEKIGAPAVEPLIAILKGGIDNKLSHWAADVLAKIGAPAVEPLITILKQRDVDVTALTDAAFTLKEIGAPAVEPVIASLKEGAWLGGDVAEFLLRIVKDPGAKEVLAAYLLSAREREIREGNARFEQEKRERTTCTRCHKLLERVDMSRGAMTVGGSLPNLYAGVICNICGKMECNNCKGSPLDKPCSWCGGTVSPAYEHLLRN